MRLVTCQVVSKTRIQIEVTLVLKVNSLSYPTLSIRGGKQPGSHSRKGLL